MTTIKIQPEFRDLIPPSTPDERAALTASIKLDGIRDKVVVWKETGILLDGHTRVEIHRELGSLDSAIPVDEIPFASADAAKAWMIENQFARRNIDASQRAMLAAKLANLKLGDNQHKKEGASNEATSQAGAAAKLNVSRSAVQRAAKVIKDGIPEVAAAVTRGEMSVSAAAHAVEVLDKDDQRAVMALPVEARREAIAGLSANPVVAAVQQRAISEVVAPMHALSGAMTADSSMPAIIIATGTAIDQIPKAFSAANVRSLTEDGCVRSIKMLNDLITTADCAIIDLNIRRDEIQKKGK